MNRLRQIHLYLGCAFAPLLCFFAISGIWQTYFLHHADQNRGYNPRTLALLSTLHTGRGLKSAPPNRLSSPSMKVFIVAMAVSLLITMLLGVMMAFRFGHGRIAMACLLGGIVVPALFIAHAIRT